MFYMCKVKLNEVTKQNEKDMPVFGINLFNLCRTRFKWTKDFI